MELAEKLKAFARQELGFDLVGITTADPLEGQRHLAAWIALGRHGEMAYMQRTQALRGEPRRLLPEAQSIICVAVSVHDPPEPPLPQGHARVARYARRRDYHKVLRKKLHQLGQYLLSLVPEARFRVAVDSAPLLEKELAQRAGLGWIGKNTCLINRRLGSELLLGELLTSVALPPDVPEVDHCGRCTACLQACPTQAFQGPYQLDARRCISYLTIEHKSPFPAQGNPPLASYLFGCDLCQTCCPWNQHAPPRINPHLPTREELAFPSLLALQSFSQARWEEWAQGTPLRRLTFSRFQRNLEALLAASQDGPAAFSKEST
jgi:epoxyqueuosine reductase